MLSLVTGLRNRPESFQRLLTSIVEHTPVEWELIVADASDEPLVCTDDRVRILREHPPMGHVKGYNRAFRAARGEWVLWLNDDAEVTTGYAKAAIDFMSVNPQVGLGALHYRDRRSAPHVSKCMGMVYANFGILSREFGEQIGWFDEDLHFYGGDNSIAFRTLLAGKTVAAVPGAVIVHHAIEDAVRMANQLERMRDVEIIQKKYFPLRRVMQRSYREHLSERLPRRIKMPRVKRIPQPPRPQRVRVRANINQ